jgi:beta-galactosidase
VVDVTRSDLPYKVLFLPGLTVMDSTTAARVRDFVWKGGTVVMTANSAVTDDHGKVFTTTHPGLLSDVFGIRVGSYEETENMNEVSRVQMSGKKMTVLYKGAPIEVESPRFDVIDTRGAQVLGTITSLDKDYPIITFHTYGKGRAIYIGLPANEALLQPLVEDLVNDLDLKRGPDVPAGVMARQIDAHHYLYLNVTGEAKEIPIKGSSRSVLFDKTYSGTFSLAPYEPEFIEVK